MDKLFISVIIPTYNRLEYFKIAINSVINQTYTNFEIIVTDDSTNDQIEFYLKTIFDSRIKYFKNKTNLGIALNTRNGILKSHGDYFAFLNDDDYWDENFLLMLVSNIKKYDNISCAFSDHWLVNSTNEKLIEKSNFNSIHYKRNLIETGIISQKENIDLFVNFSVPVAMACLIKRDMIEINNYPAEIGGAYDRWLLLQLVRNNNTQFLYVSERLTFYRVHNLSVSNTQSIKVAKSVLYIMVKSKSLLKMKKPNKSIVNKEIRSYVHHLIKKLNIKAFYYINDYIKTLI